MWFKSTAVTGKVQRDSTLKVQISRKKHCYLSNLLKFIELTAQKHVCTLNLNIKSTHQLHKVTSYQTFKSGPPSLSLLNSGCALPAPEQRESDITNYGNPIFPLFADKKVLLPDTNWGCYSLLKAACKSSNTRPASSQPSLNNLVNYLSGLRPFVSYSFSTLIKSGIAANPGFKNTERKVEKIYHHQDLPRLKEKPLMDCLPNLYHSFLHFFFCFGNKSTAVYIS